jgi:hypothetical protein
MAKQKIATVSFSPAERYSHGVMVKMSLRHGSADIDIPFASLDALIASIKVEADKLGFGCAAYIRMKGNTRKPPGFDKATDNARYYNLDTVTAE